jgi:hypothetical protein
MTLNWPQGLLGPTRVSRRICPVRVRIEPRHTVIASASYPPPGGVRRMSQPRDAMKITEVSGKDSYKFEYIADWWISTMLKQIIRRAELCPRCAAKCKRQAAIIFVETSLKSQGRRGAYIAGLQIHSNSSSAMPMITLVQPQHRITVHKAAMTFFKATRETGLTR